MMLERHKVALSAGVLGLLALTVEGAAAAPILVGEGAFTAPTLIDFNTIPDTVPITNQYAGQGVTFSGALLGLTNPGDTSLFPGNGGGTIAGNWNYTGGGLQGLSYTAVFDALQQRVGFYLENWPNQTATIELFRGAASLGTVNYNSVSLTAEFVGIEDLSGFDRLVLTNTTASNGFFAIDDFRFEGRVPEPLTMVLLGTALVVAGGRRFRALRLSRGVYTHASAKLSFPTESSGSSGQRICSSIFLIAGRVRSSATQARSGEL